MLSYIRAHVERETEPHADNGGAWNKLHEHYVVKRTDHKVAGRRLHE